MEDKPKAEKKYKIHPFQHRDRKALTRMINKLVEKTGQEKIKEIFRRGYVAAKAEETKGVKNDADILKYGIELLQLIFTYVDQDISEWFASLIDVTPEEFDMMDASVELDIIEQIKIWPGIKDFFQKALQLVSETNISGTVSGNGNQQSGSVLN